MGGHGIVGGHIPLARRHRLRRPSTAAPTRSSLCFFGEAAANIGAFHETLNMAALWKLPVIFIIENNRYGMGTSVGARPARSTDLYERGRAYDMPGEVVDGQDVLGDARGDRRGRRARARDESEPTLLEIRTYRYVGHSMSDAAHGTYRTKDEVEEYRQRDPIARARATACAMRGLLDDAGLKALDDEVPRRGRRRGQVRRRVAGARRRRSCGRTSTRRSRA